MRGCDLQILFCSSFPNRVEDRLKLIPVAKATKRSFSSNKIKFGYVSLTQHWISKSIINTFKFSPPTPINMCGRYSLAISKERISKKFNISIPTAIEPNYNVAPTQLAYVIANNAPEKLQQMNWGLVPSWARDTKIGNNLINARSESVSSKPSFRMPIRKTRCLVLADSFYEWRREGRKRIPYRITLDDDMIMVMAGIWDTWQQSNGTTYQSFAILTVPPNAEMSQVHDRMPVIFTNAEQHRQWLSDLHLAQVLNMLQTLDDDRLDIVPVSNKVNNVKSNSPDLHQPIQLPPTLF